MLQCSKCGSVSCRYATIQVKCDYNLQICYNAVSVALYPADMLQYRLNMTIICRYATMQVSMTISCRYATIQVKYDYNLQICCNAGKYDYILQI